MVEENVFLQKYYLVDVLDFQVDKPLHRGKFVIACVFL